MIDHLQFAMRKYLRLAPQADMNSLGVPREDLKVWLSDVCTAIEPYWQRPKFQHFAAWPITALGGSIETPERQLVEKVDRSLVSCAKVLLKLAENPSVRDQLSLQNPPRLARIHEAVEVGEFGSRRIEATDGRVDSFSVLSDQVKRIADRSWTDLVCAEDYLHPTGGWMERERPENVHAAEFVLQFNPSLHVIGNFVTRSLLRRVEVLFNELQDFRDKCLAALASAKQRYPAQTKKAEQAWATLNTAVRNLQTALSTGVEARMRDSCIILAQVYFANRTDCDWEWLGLDKDVITHGQMCIGHGLAALNNAEILERIAAALSDLAQLYDGDPPGQSTIEEAISGGGLVLTAEPAVFWEGKPIEVEWRKHPVPWAMLYQLAVRTRTREAVEDLDIYRERKTGSAMAMACQRLRQFLPPTLKRLVLPGTAKETYSLNLDHNRVHIFATAPTLR